MLEIIALGNGPLNSPPSLAQLGDCGENPTLPVHNIDQYHSRNFLYHRLGMHNGIITSLYIQSAFAWRLSSSPDDVPIVAPALLRTQRFHKTTTQSIEIVPRTSIKIHPTSANCFCCILLQKRSSFVCTEPRTAWHIPVTLLPFHLSPQSPPPQHHGPTSCGLGPEKYDNTPCVTKLHCIAPIYTLLFFFFFSPPSISSPWMISLNLHWKVSP